MAKPYREGATWSFRIRIKKQDIYRNGFATEAAACNALEKLRQVLTGAGRPAHDGPWRTTLGKALQTYGLERLPFLKGARQEADRINRYLRQAGLALLRIVDLTVDAPSDGAGKVVHFSVALAVDSGRRKIPLGLGRHRQSQTERTRESDLCRKSLATASLADIQSYQVQALINAMGKDGYQAASIGLERALLRRLFNYAETTWHWPRQGRNPATKLDMPTIDNGRSRILSNDEWGRLCKALEVCRSRYVAPALALLLETAMRSSETLVRLRWSDVDFERCVVTLRTAKAGAREVPLTLGAMAVLNTLHDRALAAGPPAACVLPITYETLKAAWNRACERAGIDGVNIHDLRHTSATRFSLEYHGNMPLLKVITGHKTFSQLLRYINIKPDDVVRLMHGRPLTEGRAPAGYIPPSVVPVGSPPPPPPAVVDADEVLPTNVLRFVPRTA